MLISRSEGLPGVMGINIVCDNIQKEGVHEGEKKKEMLELSHVIALINETAAK